MAKIWGHADHSTALPARSSDKESTKIRTSPRGALNQAHWTLKHGRNCLDLTLVQRREARGGEVFLLRELRVRDELLLDGVPQKLVVDVPRDAGVVDGEVLEGVLHPIERRRLPDVLYHKVVGDFPRELGPGAGVGRPSPAAAALLPVSPLPALPPAALDDGRSQLELHLAVDDILDVAHPLPRGSVQVLGPCAELEAELVAHDHAAQLRGVTPAERESGDVPPGQTLNIHQIMR